MIQKFISKMGHHWFRCALSPVLLQAIIYKFMNQDCCTDSWALRDKFKWNFKLKEFSLMKHVKLKLKMLPSKWLPFCVNLNIYVNQIILLFANCTQYMYHDTCTSIELNKWQKCARFSIAHFLTKYGNQDVNKGCKVLHACENLYLGQRLLRYRAMC